MCYSERRPFSTDELPHLLRPTATSVRPTFQSVATNPSSFPVFHLPETSAAGPHTEWRLPYPLQVPNQFDRLQQIQAPLSQSLPHAVPAKTEPHPTASSQMASNSSVVDTATSLLVPHPSTAEDTASSQCISIDEELLSFLADFISPSCSTAGQVDLGLNGLLNLSESSANSNSAAAEAASTSTSQSQMGMMKPEPQDSVNTNLTNLMSELQQLNNFGRPM